MGNDDDYMINPSEHGNENAPSCAKFLTHTTLPFYTNKEWLSLTFFFVVFHNDRYTMRFLLHIMLEMYISY